jgi:ATP synthase protein I
MPYMRPIPDGKPRPKPSGVLGAWIEAEKLMQIALLLPSAAFIGWLAGDWLGSRLHQPWLGVAGIVFGGVSGLVYVVRMALAAGKDTAFDDKSGAGPDNGDSGGDSGTQS